MIIAFTLTYVPSMGFEQKATRTICGSNKYFLNYGTPNNCAQGQMIPEKMGREHWALDITNKIDCLNKTRFVIVAKL